ncbi:hypothetical protein ABG067_002672 [Albugo candida]
MDVIIGCVGKPSAGKSTFFNAVTDGKAKTGNFPFTTIEPNEGITYFMSQCPCVAKNKSSVCQPRYGKCVQGTRHIPIKLLDVAGLIPGASEGAGLGNKFLDDLRHANVLMHIIDVSGRTNEKGEETIGYDPINDAEWLTREIHSWIYTNLHKRWNTIARRHQATKSTLLKTFLNQLSGYGASASLIGPMLDQLGYKDPCDLSTWSDREIAGLVSQFMSDRFPTILVLNKVDHGGETDKNIERIVEKYGSNHCFVCSAAAECFLRAAVKQRYIDYEPGSMFFSTAEDEAQTGSTESGSASLIPADTKIANRLAKVSDMVLFRYGSTGVRAAINAAVQACDVVVVYPVKSLKKFSTNPNGKGVFGDAILIKRDSTIRELAFRVSQNVGYHFAFAEGEDGRKLAEDDPIVQDKMIIKITTTGAPTDQL